MSSFKFGQTEIASKDFYKQKKVTDIFTINVNKMVVFDRASSNNEKGYQ